MSIARCVDRPAQVSVVVLESGAQAFTISLSVSSTPSFTKPRCLNEMNSGGRHAATAATIRHRWV